MSDDIRGNATTVIAKAARELLDLRERHPEAFARVMRLLTAEDIETLRELAAWDDDSDNPNCVHE